MKKFLWTWVPIAFVAFYIFTQPTNAAKTVGGIFSGIGAAFTSVITFMTALFS